MFWLCTCIVFVALLVRRLTGGAKAEADGPEVARAARPPNARQNAKQDGEPAGPRGEFYSMG